ncbi:baseplate J/gp47 family protein [Novacetimonas hansenii]|uniref:Baseplate protein J-like domain-containing protein n=1 Tax=Novacetimonas hansenii TaxID=436 RepID=A0ABQ0SHC2_NOVHA|nr:baseplate J/gp47 family protein [Novacetimonas hansenii]GAN84036.1 bacteriophage protein gp47 [Novacetimonas hansenii JCM 7643]GBQ55838.1 putative phage Mu protein [Novacetimonas hansenii NRIC 0243]GEC64616.1 hypothetical protein GHA01_24650 [Novacetimonas hansenii]
MYILQTYQQILSTVTNYVETETGIKVLPSSPLMILAKSLAKMIYSQQGYNEYIAEQGVPFTATDLTLEAWGTLKSITRKYATAATGNVTFTGTNTTTTIPAGTILSRADGTQYSTDTATTINEPVNITAVTAGTTGNCVSGTVLTLNSAYTGIDGTVTLANAITDGTDVESNDDLRARVIAAFQERPSGGSVSDHVTWALAVPSVTQAWCCSNPLAGNEVIVYVMLDRTNTYEGYPQGTDGAASSETRWTTATGDQLNIANQMYSNKPIGEIMIICSPIKYPVNIEIKGLTNLTTDQETQIQTELTTLFHNTGTPLGTTLYITAISAAIQSVVNTSNFTLVSPTADITTTQGQLLEVGTITYS